MRGKVFSAAALVDNSKKVVAYLSVLKNGLGIDDQQYFIEEFDGVVADIDDDVIMEILLAHPMYEGFDYTISKYNRGTFDGEKEHLCSVNP